MRVGALVYGAGLVLHTADHVRRGVGVLTSEVIWLGTISTIAGAITIALVLAGYRRAHVVAAFLGIQVAIGTAVVHLLPHWSAFSDAFPGGAAAGVTAFSWFVVLLEIAGALAMGVAGLRLLQLEGRRR